MNYRVSNQSDLHRQAIAGVLVLSNEARLDLDVVKSFRNVIPSVKNYFETVALEFTAKDETDFNFKKASANFDKAEEAAQNINMVKFGHYLLQTPEGFKGGYIEYIQWLDNVAVKYIQDAVDVLKNYYTALSVFISSPTERLSLNSTNQKTAQMQKQLDTCMDALGSFFDSKTSNALRPAADLFDRGADVKTTIKLAENLNRKRLQLRNKDLLSLTKEISQLLNLLVESSETSKIPDVSAAQADNIAKGALVAAHYVEMAGVLRYRIEEGLSAVGIMADQVVQYAKETPPI